MKKSQKSGIVVLVVLICVVIGAAVFSVFNKGSTRITPSFSFSFGNGKSDTQVTCSSDKKTQKLYDGEYIGNIYIEGTIQAANQNYNQQWLLDVINSLKNDSKNVALTLFINSPGGAVYQADEVYLALQDYRSSGKPVFVYQGPLAASGGYYISCAGTKIYANRNTLTGSIGVISGQSIDLTGLYEKLGIKSITIHSGKNKNMGNYNEPFTEEQQAIMQEIADECYEQFVNIVASQRGLSVSDVKTLADGRIYTARQALENGLIDKIDSFDGMLLDLSCNTLNKPEIPVKHFRYQKKNSFKDLLTGALKNIGQTEAAAKLGLPASAVEQLEEDKSLYPAYLYR